MLGRGIAPKSPAAPAPCRFPLRPRCSIALAPKRNHHSCSTPAPEKPDPPRYPLPAFWHAFPTPVRLVQDLMDADIRAAMFDPSYEAEELEDDFVLQASQAPEGAEADGDFDYDAHIARLIAASERRVFMGSEDRASTGWSLGREQVDAEDQDEYSSDQPADVGKGDHGDAEAQFLEVPGCLSRRERESVRSAGDSQIR